MTASSMIVVGAFEIRLGVDCYTLEQVAPSGAFYRLWYAFATNIPPLKGFFCSVSHSRMVHSLAASGAFVGAYSRIVNSTLRLSLRFSGLALSATGRVLPKPLPDRRLELMPRASK